MPRYERKAYLEVDAVDADEAEQMFQAVQGDVIGDGVLISVDDGEPEEADDGDLGEEAAGG